MRSPNTIYCNKAKFDEFYAMKKELSEISVLNRFCDVVIAKLERVCHDRESELYIYDRKEAVLLRLMGIVSGNRLLSSRRVGMG